MTVKSRYEIGLEKLATTEGSVTGMKQDLIELQPQVRVWQPGQPPGTCLYALMQLRLKRTTSACCCPHRSSALLQCLLCHLGAQLELPAKETEASMVMRPTAQF